MYHLLVDSDKVAARTMKRSSDSKEHMEWWFNRIVKLKPDSVTLWDGPILLKYNVKEQK